MNAIILSAGEGRRLRPLTLHLPKPLIPVVCRPSIEYVIQNLENAGIFRAAVNGWYMADELFDYLKNRERTELELIPLRENILLGTGGAISNTVNYIDKNSPLLVHNCDIFCEVDIREGILAHRESERFVTLFVRKGRDVEVSDGAVVDIAGRLGVKGKSSFQFTGISIWEPAAFRWLPPAGQPGCEIASLANIIREKAGSVGIFEIGDEFWCDIGSLKGYLDIHNYLLRYKHIYNVNVVIPESVRISGFFSSCSGAVIEPGARLRDVVIWKGGVVPAGIELERAVVGPFGIVRE